MSKAHFKNPTVKLCAGRSLDFMAYTRKIQASHHSFSVTDTRGESNWLGIPLSDRDTFRSYPTFAKRKRLAPWTFSHNGRVNRFVNFDCSVLNFATRVWFWYRCLTYTSPMGGAFFKPDYAPCVWYRVIWHYRCYGVTIIAQWSSSRVRTPMPIPGTNPVAVLMSRVTRESLICGQFQCPLFAQSGPSLPICLLL